MQCIAFKVERVDSVIFDIAHPAEVASFSAHLEQMTFSAERVCSISDVVEAVYEYFRVRGGGIFRVRGGGIFRVLKVGNPIEPPTPVETYTRLTYIEATGEQYINLGYVLKETDSIAVNYAVTNSEPGRIFGAGGVGDVYYSFSNGKAYARFGSTSSVSINRGVMSNYVTLSKGKVQINTWSANVPFVEMPTTPLYLFAFCEEDLRPLSYAKIQLQRFRINDESGNLIYDLIPSKRDSDRKVGLFDSVSKKFFVSDSGADFIGGSPITLPEGYTEIEGIEFNADKVFALQAITQDNSIDVMFQRNSTASSDYLYGVLSSGNTASVTAYCAGNGAWRFGSQLVRPNTADKDVHRMVITNGLSRFDGVDTTFGESSFTTPDSLVLGGYRDVEGNVYATFMGTVYFFRIWKGNNIDVELIPCVNNDGVEGFWNCVTQTFIEPMS